MKNMNIWSLPGSNVIIADTFCPIGSTHGEGLSQPYTSRVMIFTGRVAVKKVVYEVKSKINHKYMF